MTLILNALSDQQTAKLLERGSIGVLPTDTVYGLACCATNQAAVKRLYELKVREHKPGTIIAANMNQLAQLGLKARYLKAVERFWPGAITVIIPCSPELNYIDKSLRTVAVRVSSDKKLNALINKTGPLLTTSANLPNQPTAGTVQEAQAYFRDAVDFYVDGGNLSAHKPSTLIRIVDDAIEVLRQGAVTIDENTGRIIDDV